MVPDLLKLIMKKNTVYFVETRNPTASECEEAAKLNAHMVCVEDAEADDFKIGFEFDSVAGKVPKGFEKKKSEPIPEIGQLVPLEESE